MGEVIAFIFGAFAGIVLMCVVSANRISAEEDAGCGHREDDEMHETAEEYIARKYGIGGDANGDMGTESEKEGLPERVQGCKAKREENT